MVGAAKAYIYTFLRRHGRRRSGRNGGRRGRRGNHAADRVGTPGSDDPGRLGCKLNRLPCRSLRGDFSLHARLGQRRLVGLRQALAEATDELDKAAATKLLEAIFFQAHAAERRIIREPDLDTAALGLAARGPFSESFE